MTSTVLTSPRLSKRQRTDTLDVQPAPASDLGVYLATGHLQPSPMSSSSSPVKEPPVCGSTRSVRRQLAFAGHGAVRRQLFPSPAHKIEMDAFFIAQEVRATRQLPDVPDKSVGYARASPAAPHASLAYMPAPD